MTVRNRQRGWTLALVLGLAAIASSIAVTPAHAGAGRGMPPDVPLAYTQECASCHTAYPPGMLPARSWQRVMGRLDKHYGTDASLDAQAVQRIASWLQAHAGTYKRVRAEPPEDRITRSAWFERKHRKIDPSVWKLASVKTAANCAACHTGADRGDFDDEELKYPEGLGAGLRKPWND
ncbi:MAG: cytochrome C [Burkholderiaceae bacterium]|nr:cytochrome C [Burkholderiaceae bacterium]